MIELSHAVPKLSATVVILRESNAGGIEVLLLQRKRRNGSGGSWVFPGGRTEPCDQRHPDEETVTITRRAAIRETREEAGLNLEHENLILLSRWITPKIANRRFDTWFYLGITDSSTEVIVDDEEIGTHSWLKPENAIAKCTRGEIQLMGPTFVTLHWMKEHDSTSAAMSAFREETAQTFRPNVCPAKDCTFVLYPGDAGYETGDHTLTGPRHRLLMRDRTMAYERMGQL
jgi:8-oxo-dGTP pyrophosphatase MutT (NUDIX family)